MSDLRKAAQQALEALEMEATSPPIPETAAAIDALRAALAQPEPEPVGCAGCARPNDVIQSTKGINMNTITINGIEYIPATSKPTGTRAVVVVDRGWIFAGDVTRENGRIKLSRALHVFKWESIGFAKVIETETADLRPIADVDMPDGAEIFCIPVVENWGL